MSEIKEDDTVHTFNFCGATNDDGITEYLIMAPGGATLICNACIAQSEAMLLDYKINEFDFHQFAAIQQPATVVRHR